MGFNSSALNSYFMGTHLTYINIFKGVIYLKSDIKQTMKKEIRDNFTGYFKNEKFKE